MYNTVYIISVKCAGETDWLGDWNENHGLVIKIISFIRSPECKWKKKEEKISSNSMMGF